MNARQLEKLGVPRHASKLAIAAIQKMVAEKRLSKNQMKKRIQEVVGDPSLFVGDPILDDFARYLQQEPIETEFEPIDYQTWGDDIDEGSHRQMQQACCLPSARGAALMADAHIGYGLPIGGVLALEDAVVPYAVGVDIACRMKMSVLDMPVDSLESNFENYRQSLENGTFFGVGAIQDRKMDHAVFDEDWTITRVTRQNKDKARRQLGTSGSGNHFVEFGTLTINDRQPDLDLEPGTYVALMSHSGSRGAGASVCSTYSSMATRMLPPEYSKFGRLAWLDMNSQAG